MKHRAPGPFGARLKALRETAGYTQDELAAIAGLSVHAVSASGPTGGLSAATLLGFLSVSPGALAADPGTLGNLAWTFDSGSEAFDFLAAGETLTLHYTVRATDDSGAHADEGVV